MSAWFATRGVPLRGVLTGFSGRSRRRRRSPREAGRRPHRARRRGRGAWSRLLRRGAREDLLRDGRRLENGRDRRTDNPVPPPMLRRGRIRWKPCPPGRYASSSTAPLTTIRDASSRSPTGDSKAPPSRAAAPLLAPGRRRPRGFDPARSSGLRAGQAACCRYSGGGACIRGRRRQNGMFAWGGRAAGRRGALGRSMA